MPEVEYSTKMALSRTLVWDFVKDMNNWAPMLTGYQKHEILDEKDSIWTLKGDVGILSRMVRLKAHVTEWIDNDRVAFTLEGLNEKVDGGGLLVMEEEKSDAPPPPPPRKRWFGRRFMDWFARRMFRRMHGEAPKRLAAPAAAAGGTRLTFTLRMDAGGPTGPLVNAMLGPALLPAAEDLANKIAAHLEKEHLGQPGVGGGVTAGMTIGELLERAARERPDDVAVADGDTVLTTTQLRDRAHAAARALVACGVTRGVAVGIWAPNGWPWMVAALGAHTLGAIVVPINTRYKGPEAAHVLERSRARVLVTVDGFLGARYPAMLRDSGVTLPALETIVVAPSPGTNTVDAPAGTIAWDDFIAAGARIEPAEVTRLAAAVTPDDVGDIMFTSGTTGRAKAVPATHAQSLRVFADWGSLVGLRRGDRYLVVAPFFHTFGYKAGWLAALQVGAIVHPQPQFDVEQVMARIAAERITVLPGPPTLYMSLLNHPGRAAADLSSLRLAVTGAASVPVELVRRMRSDLGFDTVLTGYGLTETTGCATLCRDGDDAETVANTSGRAMPGIEVAIVDDAGQPLAAGTPGEVVVRGYNVMRGYVDDADATAETIDRDGWLRTGDIGVMDERGYLKITDRKKDMFIVGGFNAYPAEIEALLVSHPAIGQVAVVGAPDERLGEIGIAFVVPRPGTSPSEADLLTWSRDRMANFKVPRRFEIVDALPLNASGKVLKHELRARARAPR